MSEKVDKPNKNYWKKIKTLDYKKMKDKNWQENLKEHAEWISKCIEYPKRYRIKGLDLTENSLNKKI